MQQFQFRTRSTTERSLEVPGKVLVGEARRVVLLHEGLDVGLDATGELPVAPEPFRLEPGHREHAEMDEDTDLGLVVPLF